MFEIHPPIGWFSAKGPARAMRCRERERRSVEDKPPGGLILILLGAAEGVRP